MRMRGLEPPVKLLADLGRGNRDVVPVLKRLVAAECQADDAPSFLLIPVGRGCPLRSWFASTFGIDEIAKPKASNLIRWMSASSPGRVRRFALCS